MLNKNNFIIVMYHHVRKKEEKFFPKLVSLNFKKFTNQLDYLEKNYHIANIEDLANFISKKKKTKKKTLHAYI